MQQITNDMKYTVLSLVVFTTSLPGLLLAKQSKEEYVNNWKETAIEQMQMHKIPASITLAQGILESAAGNSYLAIEANNHFGIKCHDWTGAKVYRDDDKKNECFRAYRTADASFEDHSLFLTTKSRYSALFDLSTDDYVGWAKGLKAAGYATNPRYPELLIDIIEDLKLDQYDQYKGGIVAKKHKLDKKKESVVSGNAETKTTRQFYYTERKVKYILAQEGDTYYRLAQEFGMTLKEIHRYNDVARGKDLLMPGDVVFLHPKKKKGKKKEASYSKDMTLLEISNKEGIRLERLRKMNNWSEDEDAAGIVVSRGKKIYLK